MESTSKSVYEVPPGNTTVTVKLINPVNFGPAILGRFMAPPVPGLVSLESVPSNCFLLEHPSGRKLVWDLGIRKDYENYSPKVAAYIPTTEYDIQVNKNVADILEDYGVPLNAIEAVIWSHWHWDHIGDPSTFPSSTSLIVGAGFKDFMLPGAPADADSPICESDYSGRTLREINFHGLRIGQFPAFDYFGDGSLYLLDTPGHAVGHLSGLVRTTSDPDTFVILGGDVCHYSGHAFEMLQGSRGRKVTDSLYEPTFGHDVSLAMSTIEKLQELDCDDDIFVILAHDRVVRDTVDHFPKDLNAWKQRGWGQRSRWAFLKDLKAYWEEQGR